MGPRDCDCRQTVVIGAQSMPRVGRPRPAARRADKHLMAAEQGKELVAADRDLLALQCRTDLLEQLQPSHARVLRAHGTHLQKDQLIAAVPPLSAPRGLLLPLPGDLEEPMDRPADGSQPSIPSKRSRSGEGCCSMFFFISGP